MYNQKLILSIRGCQFFRNYIWDAIYYKSNGLVLTNSNELHMHIVSILNNIIVFLYQFFCDNAACGSMMQPQNAKGVAVNIFPCCWCIFDINKCIHYECISALYISFLNIQCVPAHHNEATNQHPARNFKWGVLPHCFWRRNIFEVYGTTFVDVRLKPVLFLFGPRELVVRPSVRLSTNVLARVNKWLIRSIASKIYVYLYIDGSRYARDLYYILLLY